MTVLIILVLELGPVLIFAGNDTTTNNLVHAFFNENDVTGLDFIGKLPGGVCSILIGVLLTVGFLHLFLHSILAIEAGKVADATPTETHNAGCIKLVPLIGVISGRVNPIMYRGNIFIRQS